MVTPPALRRCEAESGGWSLLMGGAWEAGGLGDVEADLVGVLGRRGHGAGCFRGVWKEPVVKA